MESHAEPPRSAPDLRAAIDALRAGAAVVYPTETFYGLGVDATNPAALLRLRELKIRQAGKPISVLVDGREMVSRLAASVSPQAEALMRRYWPGPLTIVLPARGDVDEALTAGCGTIGVRWSSHPAATALVRGLGKPVSTPSANPAGAEPPATIAAARAYFGAAVSVYVDAGATAGGKGSTIIQLEPEPRIVREGAIPAAEILAVLGQEKF